MTLWNRPIDTIAFEDIELFCRSGVTEGPRLDFKSKIPSDLAKTICAFANTLGGLIILGVDSDRTTGQAIWPAAGLTDGRGIRERISQICTDAIYPPVRPQMGLVRETPEKPGAYVLVVRIDESPETPHAINNRTRVYIRTDDRSEPIDLADIDRIQQMLDRRRQIRGEAGRTAHARNVASLADAFDSRAAIAMGVRRSAFSMARFVLLGEVRSVVSPLGRWAIQLSSGTTRRNRCVYFTDDNSDVLYAVPNIPT
jgi:schlafen family protein